MQNSQISKPANDFYAKCRLGDAGVRIDFLICPDNAYYYTDAVQRFDRQGNRGFWIMYRPIKM